MPKPKLNTGINSFNALFGEEEQINQGAQQTVKLNELHTFPNHPFKLYDDEKMQEMVESIIQYGVLMPILVRPRPQGGYEIIAGHNRVEASRRAGLTEIPATIREDVDDETAVILMVDTNFRQRETILASEKAWAFRMKLEALKRGAGRPQKNSGQVDQNLFGTTARDVISSETGESSKQIHRYIRLTHLIPQLLEMVDNKKLAFNPAVELSFLSQDEQSIVHDIIVSTGKAPSLAQCKSLHNESGDEELTEEEITVFLVPYEEPEKKKETFDLKRFAKYFPAGTTTEEMEAQIIELLKGNRQQRKRLEE